ncbi:MAG: tetratricopeptide repeat protein [Gammaproteobacteria bacterium]
MQYVKELKSKRNQQKQQQKEQARRHSITEWALKEASKEHLKTQKVAAAQQALRKAVRNDISTLKAQKRFARLTEKVARNESQAYLEIARAYELGEGVAINKKEALHWYHMAAKSGLPEAQYKIAYYYMQGESVELTQKEAIKFYELSARQCYPHAQTELSELYRTGEGGVPQDLKEARALKERAMEGFNDLGERYRDGINVRRNIPKAFENFLLAATMDHPKGLNNLAKCYRDGVGVERNLDTAKHFFKKAQDLGSLDARAHLRSLEAPLPDNHAAFFKNPASIQKESRQFVKKEELNKEPKRSNSCPNF